MSSKENYYWKKAKRFLWELSVVVTGIAITFMVGGWITNQREKKIVKNYLDAIKIELEENRFQVLDMKIKYDQINIFADYLKSRTYEEHNSDSVYAMSLYTDLYGNQYNVIDNISTLPIKSNAFEMLKSSGLAYKLVNQNLFHSLMNCYEELEGLKTATNSYMHPKAELLQNLLKLNPILRNDVEDILKPQFKELFHFHSVNFFYPRNFDICLKQLETALSLL